MTVSSVRWGSVLGLLVCLLLTAGGLLPFFNGQGGLKPALIASFFGLCFCCYAYDLLGHAPKAISPATSASNVKVSFTDSKIVATYEGGETRTATWFELSKVGITTTDEGPFVQDVFWGLHAGERVAVAYPQDAVGSQELLTAMQERLPNFNNHAVIEAMGSTSNAHFVVWDRATPSMEAIAPQRRTV